MVSVLDDKRIFERFSAAFPLKFLGSSQSYGVEGRLQDASAGGARIVTRRCFEKGDLVAVDIRFSKRDLSVLFMGKVAWMSKLNANLWTFGFEFHKSDFLKVSSLYEECL